LAASASAAEITGAAAAMGALLPPAAVPVAPAPEEDEDGADAVAPSACFLAFSFSLRFWASCCRH
jgi:hypothetical protein